MSKKPIAKMPRRRGRTTSLAEPIFYSDFLPTLREFIESVDHLRRIIGPIASFHVVVDANILISDVLWHLTKKKKPSAQTMLQECIGAGTIIAYATPTVIREVEEKLPLRASQCGLHADVWMPIWSEYTSVLKVREPESSIIERYAAGQDPDDAPTLALADMLTACGILTRDSDIAAMGGNAIPIEFVLHARDYSRRAVVSVSIKIGGYYVCIGATEGFSLLTKATKQCGAWLRKQPVAVRLGAFLVLLSLIVHPRSRNAIVELLQAVGSKVPGILAQLVQVTAALAHMAADNDAVPPTVPDRRVPQLPSGIHECN